MSFSLCCARIGRGRARSPVAYAAALHADLRMDCGRLPVGVAKGVGVRSTTGHGAVQASSLASGAQDTSPTRDLDFQSKGPPNKLSTCNAYLGVSFLPNSWLPHLAARKGYEICLGWVTSFLGCLGTMFCHKGECFTLFSVNGAPRMGTGTRACAVFRET